MQANGMSKIKVLAWTELLFLVGRGSLLGRILFRLWFCAGVRVGRIAAEFKLCGFFVFWIRRLGLGFGVGSEKRCRAGQQGGEKDNAEFHEIGQRGEPEENESAGRCCDQARRCKIISRIIRTQ